jgi:hypothetical protein
MDGPVKVDIGSLLRFIRRLRQRGKDRDGKGERCIAGLHFHLPRSHLTASQPRESSHIRLVRIATYNSKLQSYARRRSLKSIIIPFDVYRRSLRLSTRGRIDGRNDNQTGRRIRPSATVYLQRSNRALKSKNTPVLEAHEQQ